jgi:hypothetical protein
VTTHGDRIVSERKGTGAAEPDGFVTLSKMLNSALNLHRQATQTKGLSLAFGIVLTFQLHHENLKSICARVL